MARRRDDSVQADGADTPAPEMIVVTAAVAEAATVPVVTVPVADSVTTEPTEPDIKLSAAQYVQVRGYRWQRAAGFLREAREKFPGNRTRPEWDKLWEAFLGRPVG